MCPQNKTYLVTSRTTMSRVKKLIIFLSIIISLTIIIGGYFLYPTIVFKFETKNLTVTFITNSENEIPKVKTTNRVNFSVSDYQPTREGYTFEGWFTDPECNNKYIVQVLNSDLTLYAKWNKNFNVEFNSGDHGKLINLLGEQHSLIKYDLPLGKTTPSVYVLPDIDYYFMKWNDQSVEKNKKVVTTDTGVKLKAIYLPASQVKQYGDFKYLEDEQFIKIVAYLGNQEIVEIINSINGKPVKVIGDQTFINNATMTKLILNQNLEYIEPKTFSSCNKLKTIDTSNNQMFEVNMQAMLLSNGGTTLVSRLISEQLFKTIAIEEIKYIEPFALANNSFNIVSIDSNLIELGIGAFANCVSMYQITFSGQIELISYQCFYNNKSLKSFRLTNNGISKVGKEGFYNCNALNPLFLPSLNYIGDEAFYNTRIEELILVEVEYMGKGAFRNNIYLKTVLIISLIEIPNLGFKGCVNLKTVTFPNNLEKIGYAAFSLCSSLESIELPNSLLIIEDDGFLDCIKLASVKMSENITKIGYYAFYNCQSLKEIKLYHKDIQLFPDSFDQTIIITAPKKGSVEEYCKKYGITIK